jgi:two-component system, chemotaxis family, chemotaxis protein CheY
MAVILIVDDNADSRWILSELVGRDHHQVLEACDGREAVEIYRARRPDLVMLDLYMPGQDGFETLRILRAEYPASRIIAVSAGWNKGDKDGLTLAREMGADLTIRKPIDMNVVRHAVSELLATA